MASTDSTEKIALSPKIKIVADELFVPLKDNNSSPANDSNKLGTKKRESKYTPLNNTRRDYWVNDDDARMSILQANPYRTRSTLHQGQIGRYDSVYSPEVKHHENENSDHKDNQPIPEKTNYQHIAPDWFKISIKQVERHGASGSQDEEVKTVCEMINEACSLRDKWVYSPKTKPTIGCSYGDEKLVLDVKQAKEMGLFGESLNDLYKCEFRRGVMHIYNNKTKKEEFEVYSFDEYMEDLSIILALMAFGPAKTLCYRRLQILQSRFQLHLWLNDHIESKESKSVPHRDFYNVRKIDNHVHHSACMHQKHLLRFIKSRLKSHPNLIVTKDPKTGETKTLKQIFDDLHLNLYDLSIDALDMHAHQETFHRFDKFNAKYNPLGKAVLRDIFLKVDNYIDGKFLADITKEVFDDLEWQKYQLSEYRLSIYGKKKQEWDTLAQWICKHNLKSVNVRWLIQIPRIYPIFKKTGIVESFGQMLDNIFGPLFEVTLDPNSHPELHLFLQHVVGIDSVDDESVAEQKRKRYPDPQQWTMNENPPYILYMYYTWANLTKLNRLREERGLNTFSFRPHAGEAGDFDHIASTFLLAHGINHGITLKNVPVLQYLYYLKQIGISMSPLSNNILFCEYDKNPFPILFKRGLNVTLSTDDPLLIHYTKDPLLEEYSIAAQVYNLSSIDLCEIARNSVLQCCWDHTTKQLWIGKNYNMRGAKGNNIYRTNVPDARLEFRHLLLYEEENFIRYAGYPDLKRYSINAFALLDATNPISVLQQTSILSSIPDSSNDQDTAEDDSDDEKDPKASQDKQLKRYLTQKIVKLKSSKNLVLPIDNTNSNNNNNNNKININDNNKQEELKSLQNNDSSSLSSSPFVPVSKNDILQQQQQSPKSTLISINKNKIDDPIIVEKAKELAKQNNSDITQKPPHEEWIKLAQEKRQLEILRDEIAKYTSQNTTESTRNLIDDMMKSKSLSNMLPNDQHSISTMSASIFSSSSSALNVHHDKKDNNNNNNNNNNIGKFGKKGSKNFIENAKKLSWDGEYYDENNSLNKITADLKIRLCDSNNVINAYEIKPNDQNGNARIEVNLEKSNQQHILDEDHKISDLFGNQTVIVGELDAHVGEIIWNSGTLWFKKEWSLLIGTWEDDNHNFIEVKKNNTCQYVKGFGPFNGDIIGFKTMQVQLPNGGFIKGNLVEENIIVWENDTKWKRYSEKGCIVM